MPMLLFIKCNTAPSAHIQDGVVIQLRNAVTVLVAAHAVNNSIFAPGQPSFFSPWGRQVRTDLYDNSGLKSNAYLKED